eukprot:7934500-Pyramimonas_sp.AAC.1
MAAWSPSAGAGVLPDLPCQLLPGVGMGDNQNVRHSGGRIPIGGNAEPTYCATPPQYILTTDQSDADNVGIFP